MNSVFISSTFRDMHFERDILNRAVSARLNHRLAEFNRSVRLLDLRWGVDTSDLSEEEATDRVLKVCFDSIENCRPYMVILLGDRYGYAPGADGISVTHMEIIRGALESSDPRHIFVYCREADYSGMPEEMRKTYMEQNPAASAKLEALKAELWQKLPRQCRRYQAYWSEENQCLVSDTFETMVYEDLKQDLLDSLTLKRYRSELHKQLSENDDILRDNLQHAYCNQAELNARIGQVQAADKPFGLTGQAGAGKSVYMSLLCSALRSAGETAYILFCGDNAFSASVRNAAETVLYCLTEASGEEYDFEANGLLSYDDLLQKLMQQREKATGKTYFLLDAVDKCEEGMFHFLLWCHRFLSENIAIVFSSQNTEALAEAAQSFTISAIQYDSDALREMALRLLQKYGKSLNSALISQLCQKATTPLQLHILLLRLINQDLADFAAIEKMGGGMEAINAHLQKLIADASDDETEMLEDYLLSLLDQSAHPHFDLLLLSFLVQSDQGLMEADLQHLMELATIPWVQMDYMDFLVTNAFFIRIRESGRLDISHDTIRRSFRKILQSQEKMICHMLTDHFFLSEQTDAHTVSGFFHAAYRAEQTQQIIAFLMRHQNVFSSLESEDIILVRQIRKTLSDLLLQDDCHFLMGIFENCQDLEQFCTMQRIITSSMLHLNDYLTDKTAMRILQICLTIPIQLEVFPPDLALMELSACEKFAQRHNFTDPDISAFFAYCHKQLDIRRGQYGYAAPEAHIVQPDMVYADLAEEQNIAQQALVLEDLSTMGRELATEPDCADVIKPLLLSLLQTIQGNPLELPQALQSIHIAGIYTSLGVLGKTTKNWEEGLLWDEKSAAICELLYQEDPSPDMFRKYRARVYNIANLIEAWAMEEKTNIHLWQRTRDSYARLYDLEMQAIAHGIPDRELLQCASSILSYGTSLINCGDYDGGIEKFREGGNLVLELTANNPRPELYLELSLHQMECVHQLCMVSQFRAALEFSSHIFQCTDLVLQQGEEAHKKTLWKHCSSFLGHLSQLMAQLAPKQDLENILLLYRLQDNMYSVLLPTGSADVKAGIMVTKRNIGNFLLHKQDYAGAAESYLTLLKLVREKDLVQPNPMGQFDDRATLSLCNVFVRTLLCLEQLQRNDTIKELIDAAPDWARFICSHTNCLQGDAPRVLYVMGADLSQQNSPLGMILVMLAFQEMQAEGYDIQAHRDTAVMILKAVEQIEKDLDNK